MGQIANQMLLDAIFKLKEKVQGRRTRKNKETDRKKTEKEKNR